MLIGFLLPLLRRLSTRTRMLIAVAVIAAGLALALPVVLQGHPHGPNVLYIRLGLLLTVAGLGLFVSGLRASRREER